MNETDSVVRLIVSDLHLGSAYSKEKDFFNFLSSVEFDELILAGDIIEFLRKPIFTKETSKIINLIKSLKKRIVYIVGNHDNVFNSFVGREVSGIEFVKTYDFSHQGRKFRVQHGDQYETGIVHWRYTIQFISFLQDFFERVFKVDLTTWWAHRQLKKRKLKRIWDIVKWNEDADVYIMGHTHNPEVLIWVDKNEKIKTYVNTGDWVSNSTYVIVKDGQVRLRNWKTSNDEV